MNRIEILKSENTDLRARLAGTWNEKDLWRIIKDMNDHINKLQVTNGSLTDEIDRLKRDL